MVISFVPTALNEIKPRHGTWQFIKIDTLFWPLFAAVQNQDFGSDLNTSAKYEPDSSERFKDQNLSSLRIENNPNLRNQQFSFHVLLH